MARTLLYKRAETEMRRRIEAGDWPVGMRLGNEFQLADEFGVSQGTMRRALMTLEAEGLLSRKPGRGTVVAEPQVTTNAVATGTLRGPDGLPAAFEIHRAKTAARPVSGAEAAMFADGTVRVLERLLKLDGDRAALEELVVPSEQVDELDEAVSADLSEALSDMGLGVSRIEDRISAEITSMSDSVALSCDRNTPLLCLTRTAKDEAGKVVARQVIRVADRALSYS